MGTNPSNSPSKDKGFTPEPNSCLSPSSQEAPQSLINIVHSHLIFQTHTVMAQGLWRADAPVHTHVHTRMQLHTPAHTHSCPLVRDCPPVHPDSPAWSFSHGQGPTTLHRISWVQKAAKGHVSSTHFRTMSRNFRRYKYLVIDGYVIEHKTW